MTEILQQPTDPTRTLLTWREFSDKVAERIDQLKLNPPTTETDLIELLAMMDIDLMDYFEDYLFLMMMKGILFATEHMNRLSPKYHFEAGWTPADDKLLADLLAGCWAYLYRWTDYTVKEAIKEINEGTKAGESIEQIGSRVAEVIGKSRNRGTLIARTELMRAWNKAAQDRYNKAGFDIIWMTARDPIVCDICEPLDGKPISEIGFIPPIHPNCLSDDTEVLTIDGFKFFKDVTKNDLIASLNPHNFYIQYLLPINLISYFYEGKMIHYKSRNVDLLMTPDHQVPYISKWNWDHNKTKIKWRNAEDLAVSNKLPRHGFWQGIDMPITIGNIKFSPETFVKFMAWWLSDGSITKRGKNWYQIKIAQEDHIDWLLEDLENLNLKISVGETAIYINNSELGKYLTQFGKSWTKYIPSTIKQLTPKILRLFLDTYRKADGQTRAARKWKNGNFKDEFLYFTSSKQLTDDLCEIILKAGNHPSVHLQKPTTTYDKKQKKYYTTKHPSYVIRECRSQFSHVQKRYITKEDYSGFVYDVELPFNHILFVRRNGKCIWTGNCRCGILPVLVSPSSP